MKKILLFSILLSIFIILNAQNETELYQIKSGKFITETISNEMNMTTTIFFQDYGKKMYSETDMITKNNETEIHNKIGTIVDGNTITQIFFNSKSYITMTDNENYEEDEYDDDEEDYFVPENIVGEEVIMNRKCKIYQTEDAKIWLWKGMTLKHEVVDEGIKIVTTIKEINENYKVPNSKFQVPEGFIKQENPINIMLDNMTKTVEQNKQENDNNGTDDDNDSEDLQKALKEFKGLFN